MKTIPVSLIIAGILAPVVSLAQTQGGPQGPPPRDGGGKRGPHRPFEESWKAVDQDRDGFLTQGEFGAMPRIQNLPEEKRGQLFKRLDKNGDGKLACEELSRMGKLQNGQAPPMKRLWELDVDKSGGVSLEEFKAGQLFKKLPSERQQAVFRRLDTNGDGTITPKDKPNPSFKRGEDQRPHRADGGKPDGPRIEPRQIIRQLDKDGDGDLSFEEFRAGPVVRNLSEDEQEDRFESMDQNDDLKLTAEEFPPPAPRKEPKAPAGQPPADETGKMD